MMCMAVRTQQVGYVYIGLLFAIVILGALGSVAILANAREGHANRLAELEWSGKQLERAIRSYYEATPGLVVKGYPSDLHDLLLDQRYPSTVRHVRAVYRNPFSKEGAWILMRTPTGHVCGVAAQHTTPFGPVDRRFFFLAATPESPNGTGRPPKQSHCALPTEQGRPVATRVSTITEKL